MSALKEDKGKIIKKFQTHGQDTGSPEVQVALLTTRIQTLADHLKHHKKDMHSRRGLLMMVGKRRRLLKYLLDKNPIRHQKLIKTLKLRS